VGSRSVIRALALDIVFAFAWLNAAQAASVDRAAGSDVYERLYDAAVAARLEATAQTVTGPVRPESLGVTLMHEHLFVDFLAGLPWSGPASQTHPEVLRRLQQTGWTVPKSEAEREFFNRRELTFDMVDRIRRGWRSRTNLLIDSEREVADEIASFQREGGRTIVDLTPHGLGRNLPRLREVSRRTGLQTIAGTGWYRWPYHPAELREWTLEQLTERLVLDVVSGADSGGVRAGIIGEIPLDSRSIRVDAGDVSAFDDTRIRTLANAAISRLSKLSLDEREKVPLGEIYDGREIRVLQAAARASRLTGAALSLHAREPWLGYLPIILNEGVAPGRIIVGHAHEHFTDRALLERALRAGVVLQADYYLQFYASASPLGPLEEILDGVAWAIRSGYRDQLLLSLDLCNKLGQQRYGGGGFATLHNHVFARLRARGVTDADIGHVMVENPRRLLTFGVPQRVRVPAATSSAVTAGH
jgi:phosphotriesterase-related protein